MSLNANTTSHRASMVRAFRKGHSIVAAVFCLSLNGTALAQDNTVLFDVTAPGVDKSISIWGLDTAWLSESNVRRGVEFMGKEQVDVIRFSFTGDRPLINGDLETTRQAEFNERMRIVDTYTKQDAALYFNSDTIGIDSYFKDGSGNLRADRWAELIDLTRRKAEDAGRTVLSVAPFNEPDFVTNGYGNVGRLEEIARLFRQDSKYKESFADIRIAGGGTLNNDLALEWYSPLKDLLDEGNTHQLAGGFDTYASFFEYVVANGDIGINDELHNVMEAMVGAEYGMDVGIWWGSAEYARGEFVKASDGTRLGYSENRPNWTAASVYRAPDGKIQAFVGESERQARPTSFQFVSTDRDVFFDGVGPQRTFTVNTTGGSGYQTSSHSNAERVINITWGDDIQPVIKGRYTLVNRQSGKILEVQGGGTGNGSHIQQGTPNYESHQSWLVDRVPRTIGGDWSYFTIKPFNATTKTIDVWNWNLNAGAEVRLYDYLEGINQQWVLEYVEDGYFYIRSRFSGKYLEVANGSTENGARVQLGDGPGGHLQQWRFVKAGALVEFEAPAAPTGLKARANAVSVTLSWEANDENDLSGYSVYRSVATEGPYELIAREVVDTTFIDKGAYEAQAYFYRIKATDGSGNQSEYSDVQSVSPSSGPTLALSLNFEQSLGDGSGNANDAEATHAPAYLDGKVGASSLYFNGVNNFISLPATIADHAQISVACWVYWSGGSDDQRIFEFGDDVESRFYLSPSAAGSGLRFVIENAGKEAQLNATALDTNRWTHLAVVLGETKAQLYVDGSMVDESSSTVSLADISSNLNLVGKNRFNSWSFYRGRLDDFQIHNFALSANEVAAVAGLVSPPVPTGLATTVMDDEIVLSWDSVPGATAYAVRRSESSDGPFVALASNLSSPVFVDTETSGKTKFYYEVAASNDAGSSLYSDVSFASLLSFAEEWRELHFGVTENAGEAADDADPDKDGIINLLERAFAGNPKRKEGDLAPYLDDSVAPLAIVYRRAVSAADLAFRVLESSDLSPEWAVAEGTSEVISEEGGVQWVRFVRRLEADEDLFLRLQVKSE
ncbi:RICIN domain-containing protein [Pelagicoccus sp. NFK12]|uniref:RICIN domain-containing protein n=1 Tax=Pelagicoccus enzymogenes TaxID=2773457 RepID=A0A927IJM3_9BACT|nr:RICIN domain-containing protein [Pelagicoccus enzymogenes]MBD5782476.1 RICIN domain-containing protein [Pelagicoccus enzymogenes]